MYFRKLHITHFRCFEDYEIEFAPHVTVLFGKNGSGKTSLIHALHKALSFMMHSEKIKEKDPKTKKMKPVGERSLRGGNPYVGVEGFALVGDYHRMNARYADDLLDIRGTAILDEQTPMEWGISAYASNCRLRPSEYKEAFEILYNWHEKTGKRPLLAYYSDGYPYYTNVANQKKERTKEEFLVKSSFESIGYTDWNSETGCTNTWLVRLETKFRTIENMKRRIGKPTTEEVYAASVKELNIAEKEVGYITAILKRFSENELKIAVEDLEISSYDARLHILAKDGTDYSFRNLPAGYKRLFYMALDIAYRSFLLSNGDDMEIEGVVIMDEIDLHLHPELEKVVLGRFMKTFPKLQFIVSTHSQLVLTGVKTVDGQNRILKMEVGQHKPVPMFDMYGLDLNSGMQEVMDIHPNDDELNRWISRCAYMRSKGYDEQARNLEKFVEEKGLISAPEIERRINEVLKELG